MKNRKEFTIIFERSSDSGIAKITIYNITNNAYLNASNQEVSSYSYFTFDLYIPSTGYSSDELACAFTVSLQDDCEYLITIEHSGTNNASASSPYKVGVLRFLSTEKFVEGSIEGTLRLWHSKFPLDFNDFAVDKSSQQSFTLRSIFSGDGVTRKFWVNDIDHASKFVRFSKDGGETWILPNNLSLAWGSNENCDNNVFDENGYGGVNFDMPPDVGENNVIIEWVPMVNKFKLIQKINQPQSISGDIIDLRTEPLQFDFAIELIP